MKFYYTLIVLCSFLAATAQKQVIIRGAAPNYYIDHTVAGNETFLKIGSLYNVSPVKLSAYNSLSLSHNLTTGENLKIPVSTQNLDQKGQKGVYEILVPVYHISETIESLKDVSARYNLSIETLREWNTNAPEAPAAGAKTIIGYLRVKKELAAYFSATPTPEKKVEESKTEKPKPSAPVADTTSTKVEVPGNYDSDKLFEMARKAAFDNKNYPLAIAYCKAALIKSPDYSDIRVFLGRIYTWTDKTDSARSQFAYVIKTDSAYIDAYVAYADLEYWNDRPKEALDIINKGLNFNQDSKELLIRKAKMLNILKQPKEAQKIIERLIKIDPKNTEVRAMSTRMRELTAGSKLGISYDYTYFDKQFSDPWHLVSIDYSRQTSIGSIGGRVNYANRFKSSGVQYEVEAYPNISKTFYSYVDFAYSDDEGLFPKYRGGFSLYASLPKSYEGELGFRYLQFGDATWIYTAAIGKYYKSWLFNARTYLTPGTVKVSQSYNIGARYYYGSAYDYVGLVLGTGISPDERPSALLINSNYKLISEKAAATYKHEIRNRHIITLNASWISNEYLPKTKGNQLEGGIAYQYRL